MEKYKIGIIGYGGFGKFLDHWWSKLDNIEVIAVADSGQHYHKIKNYRVYHDWKELIEDQKIDIVSIVTPPSLHAEMACAAMLAGKHVLLEKPVAICREDARRILEVQKQTGKRITVNHMIRYNPIIRELMQIGESGSLGQLHHAVVNNYAQDESLAENHWFWDEQISGGIMVEHGVHFFDIINALGRQHYQKVNGASQSRNDKQRDRVSALVAYDKGLTASYYHAFSGPGFFERTTISLVYDLARVEIEGWMPMKGKLEALTESKNAEAFKRIPGWKETKKEFIAKAGDDSRPEGWGEGSESASEENRVVAGGIAYKADQIIHGTFEITQSKGEVYGKCVQEILLDLILNIEDQNHKLAVTIEDAVEALEIALLASDKSV
ncbi:Gfo/Idh/MocA family protein [Flavobacterium foetidum]|uniref:Gfo/Idh/MocA family protein n=1 Tax=Flavobacterium foetidum TaxID=2026681 RepID=UPI001074B54B|nr:Gfo/Idh/MocA family oxidoreductase [Flavobacterium foetidum]KAF2514915.1 Gfo/Idh/MocA family oxidoreductase [Flavobacterium foetidum]